MIIIQVLCNRYTKTQSYMQYGTMSMKNLVGRLGVHNKTDHTLVSEVISLGKIIGRPVRVMLFCENAPTTWDRHRFKEALKPSVFILRSNPENILTHILYL